MHFRRIVLSLSIATSPLVFSPLPAQPAAAPSGADWFYRGSDIPADPAWRFGTLPNGVRTVVRKNALPAGQVSIRVRIDAGSLHEADAERGWAHLVEHLAFRGTKSFGDREARQTWQKLGASFGSDSNASTSPTQTVYQLDLPNADESEVDLSLNVIAEMMDSALFDPAAVKAEQNIVLAEKGRRPELTNRMIETSWPLIFAGLKIAERDTIGTDATLRAADATTLRAFYERWYRPEHATVIVVGDIDPAAAERLIAKHFGAWRGTGPAPQAPDYGRIADVPDPTAAVVYPGAPYNAQLTWLRPYVEQPNSKARERGDLARSLAARILNRRLEQRARGDAAYVTAAVREIRQTDIADSTSLNVTARGDRWQDALGEVFGIVNDALRAPPSEAEIARELSNLKTAAQSSLAGESTVQSQVRAGQIINAIDGNSVITSAKDTVALLEEFAPAMTPAAIDAAMKELFSGTPPRLVLLSPQGVPADTPRIALAAAVATAPSARTADRTVTMDSLPALGDPGREVSRERIEDMGVDIVRFANGSSLTFKRTDYELGSVQVQLRFGKGIAGLPADRVSLHGFGSIVAPSGLADLDLDGLERLLTGRKMTLTFGVGEDAFVMRGQTNGADLADQMRLLATKIAYPRWDPAVFARAKVGTLESYDLAFASAASRGQREFPRVARDDDRWAPLEKATIAATDIDDVRAFFDPLLAAGPIEATIVGDVDLETAVQAMRATIAALPQRAPVSIPDASRSVAPPAPAPAPKTFTHQGDANQAFALIGWSTFGGFDNIKDKRALSLAANMMQVRLFDRFREAEGASYSPAAASNTSQIYKDWGIFYAASEIRPESAEAFYRAAREIVADLAAKPAEADEFARAQNPVISGIERRLRTNAYWVSALDDWTTEPRMIAETRSYLTDYQGLTAEDVRAAVARHVAEQGDWSMLVVPAKT